jgi:hypothetical protein
MNINDLFDHPGYRRLWLLSKALEFASLDDALRLARSAEAFLDFNVATAPSGLARSATTLSGRPEDASTFVVPPPIDSAEDNRLPLNVRVICSTAAEPPPREAAGIHTRDVTTDTVALQYSTARASVGNGLAVLASPEDVVRFLRQQNDVVVSAGDDAYLVNGRCRENLVELTARANRMRRREKKPVFELSPLALCQQLEIQVQLAGAGKRGPNQRSHRGEGLVKP